MCVAGFCANVTQCYVKTAAALWKIVSAFPFIPLAYLSILYESANDSNVPSLSAYRLAAVNRFVDLIASCLLSALWWELFWQNIHMCDQ